VDVDELRNDKIEKILKWNTTYQILKYWIGTKD
jgi:hypothetical protein